MKSALITPEEADALLRKIVRPARAVDFPLAETYGLTLREPIVADRDLPPYDRVMMDGYALRHTDGTNPLKVQAKQLAGEPPLTLSGEPGYAIEVMTGSMLPHGADCVVPYEATQREGEHIKMLPGEAYQPGQYIHRKGLDCAAGRVQVEPGARLGPVEIAMAASCGYACLRVSQPPRVSVFSTGDELVPIEAQPAAHQVRRSNGQAMTSALAAWGYRGSELGHLSDEVEKSRLLLDTAISQSDVVVLSGGVSMGALDWIPEALDRLGTRLFHGVSQRPGKPMGAWTTDGGCMVFALPGNPVSSLVGVYRYVLPYLRARSGVAYDLAVRQLPLAEPWQPLSDKTLYLPVTLNSQGEAVPKPTRNSGDFAGLLGTTGFVVLDKGEDMVEAGTKVLFVPWNP